MKINKIVVFLPAQNDKRKLLGSTGRMEHGLDGCNDYNADGKKTAVNDSMPVPANSFFSWRY